jgi:hypothetical protein
MVILINFTNILISSWGSSWLLWLSGPIWLSTIGFAVVEIIEDRKDKKKSMMPAEGPTDTPMPPTGKRIKKMAAMGRVILILLLPVVGYAVGIHRQSKQDAKFVAERYSRYDTEHAAWLERSKQWAKDFDSWKTKHPQEKINARRSVSAAATTGTATYTTPTESRSIRGESGP